MNESRKTVLVVGSTGSIGHLVVEEAVRQGYVVRALVRTPSKARRFPAQVEVIPGDVTRSDASLTLLVNNAGIGTPKRVLGEDVDRLEGAVELNVVTVHRLAIAAAQTFAARGHGRSNLRITTSFRQGCVTCATRPARRPNHEDVLSDYRELYRTPRRSVEMR